MPFYLLDFSNIFLGLLPFVPYIHFRLARGRAFGLLDPLDQTAFPPQT